MIIRLFSLICSKTIEVSIAKCHWTQVYRTTGTPCSCWMCRGMEYDRLEYKRETRRIIRESMELE